jgi:hypothetical protein
MASPKLPVYITEDGTQTIVPVTSHAGDEISGPPQRQAALDAHETARQASQPAQLDIEHQPVENDPRLWSKRRKVLLLLCLARFNLTLRHPLADDDCCNYRLCNIGSDPFGKSI